MKEETQQIEQVRTELKQLVEKELKDDEALQTIKWINTLARHTYKWKKLVDKFPDSLRREGVYVGNEILDVKDDITTWSEEKIHLVIQFYQKKRTSSISILQMIFDSCNVYFPEDKKQPVKDLANKLINLIYSYQIELADLLVAQQRANLDAQPKMSKGL